MPVFRNMAHTGYGAFPDGRLCDILPVHQDFPFNQRFQPGQSVYEL